jgi:FemAB-related protein (PEP-CTERM system-associated)
MNTIASQAVSLLASSPHVRIMSPDDVAKWDEFVYTCPAATFFHRAGWKDVIERAFGHRTYFLLAEEYGEIQGVLPLAEINSRLFGHSLSALPFCVYGGIAASTAAAEIVLDQAAQTLASQLDVDFLEYRNLTPLHREWPSKDLYFTFRKTIDPDLETNLLAIPNRRRAMIRKGIKYGLRSEIDNDIERFFPVFAGNVHRHGTPALPKKYFAILKEVFGNDCEILSVLKEQQVLSSVLSFYFRDEVLAYYAGDTVQARDLAANDFKYWELMRRACERGIKVFDYGRSKRGTGTFDFKKNWGFEPQPLHYEYQLHRAKRVPDTNPLNPKFQLFIKLWQKLPLPVANWIGPHIVKNLG